MDHGFYIDTQNNVFTHDMKIKGKLSAEERGTKDMDKEERGGREGALGGIWMQTSYTWVRMSYEPGTVSNECTSKEVVNAVQNARLKVSAGHPCGTTQKAVGCVSLKIKRMNRISLRLCGRDCWLPT